jgi:hypothetical protein
MSADEQRACVGAMPCQLEFASLLPALSATPMTCLARLGVSQSLGPDIWKHKPRHACHAGRCERTWARLTVGAFRADVPLIHGYGCVHTVPHGAMVGE